MSNTRDGHRLPVLSTTEVLQRERQHCLDALRSLSPQALKLVTELESLDMALLHISDSDLNAYTAFRRPIDAVIAFLERNGRVMRVEEIACAIVDGGWRKRDKQAHYSLRSAIDYHARRQGIRNQLIRTLRNDNQHDPRESNTLVGLYHWPDEKWE